MKQQNILLLLFLIVIQVYVYQESVKNIYVKLGIKKGPF
mgnify:CR=1 FL=1|jgi:hypothetical protein